MSENKGRLYFTSKVNSFLDVLHPVSSCVDLEIFKKFLIITPSLDHILGSRMNHTWFTESRIGVCKVMACARVPLDEQQVTEPGPLGQEHTLPALVRYCSDPFNTYFYI